jgi:signal transduction histidine kinase/DNA-binding response OmpR family regulator
MGLTHLPFKILYTEDNPDYAKLIGLRLTHAEDYEFQLKWTNTLQSCLTCIEEENYDAILLDLSLPDSAGLSTFDAVFEKAPNSPIVILTAIENDRTAIEAIQRGAQDYLIKSRVTGKAVSRVLAYAVERKRLLEKTRKISAAYQSAFENAIVPMMLVSYLGQILSYNSLMAKTLGISENKGMRESFAAHCRTRAKDNGLGLGEQWAEIREKKGAMICDQKGNLIPVRLSLGTSGSENSNVHDQIFTITLAGPASEDMSAQKQLEAAIEEKQIAVGKAAAAITDAQKELRELEASSSQLLAAASHELKSPITAIKGYLELLHRDLSTTISDSQSELLDLIRLSIDNLHQRSKELLQLSMLEGKNAVRMELCDLTNLVLDMFAIYKGLALQKNIDYVLEMPEPLKKIWCDITHVKTIFGNLLSNALKYTGDGGIVVLRVKNCEAGINIEVSDTGIGIPVGQHNKIFDAFSKIDRPNGQSDSYDSTGFGLSLVKKIVDVHRGHIHFESQDGKGATFFVFLPEDRRKLGDRHE